RHPKHREGVAMISALVGLLFIGGLVVLPLAWRLRQDRRAERALTVRAYVHAALVRALGGESLVAVTVEPPALWRAGRVVLTAPSDWRCLLAPSWSAVVDRVPADYELVVKPAAEAALPAAALALHRAA
ncbi:MAG TPA: hypothetical protein VFL90_06085, partial [Methylomirabilota bacterium]|nr:hypothetical protein [Methylomirabilota bacterium]